MDTPHPKYDPAELEAAGLTEEEAEGIRLALEEIDKAETMAASQVYADARARIQARTKARLR